MRALCCLPGPHARAVPDCRSAGAAQPGEPGGSPWAGSAGRGCPQPPSRLAGSRGVGARGLRGVLGRSVPALLGRARRRQALLPAPNTRDRFLPLPPLPGTPTEDTWPGITSNEEFKAYNFTQYRAQPLINHAPRYLLEQGHVRHGGLALVVKGSLGGPVSFLPCGAGSF